MSIILDIIIVAIILFNIIFAWKQGFVKMVLRSLTLVVALIAAFSFTAPVRDYFLGTEQAEKWENKIYDSVITMLDGTESEEKEEPKIGNMLSALGLDGDEITKEIEQWKETKKEEIKISVAEKCAPLLLKAAVTFFSFLTLFISVAVCATVIVVIIDKSTELPVLKQANTLLGIIVGIVLAIAESSVFASLVQMILPYNTLGGIFSGISVDGTYLFKIFCNYNIFRMLF